MDQLLLPYLQARDDSEQQRYLDELLLAYAVPIVRQALRRRLAFYVDSRGVNPHNQDAEDLFQEIMTKIVQALHDLRNPSTKTVIENLEKYVARIALNSCNDVLRTKSPSRTRLKYNLRFVLSNHEDFAVWKTERATLTGFAAWRDSGMSTSAATPSNDFEERLANFRARHFPQENIKQVPLTRILAELFRWMSSPIELGELINIVAALQDVRDRPAQPSDDDTPAHFEESVQDSTLRSHSRLEEQAVLRSLWQAVRELSAEQRDVFCLGFEDECGRDLFTVLLEAETVTFRELSQELGRSTEEVVRLWSKMPMENQAIAAELKVTRAQVYKWRFRALERLKKGLLPFSGKK